MIREMVLEFGFDRRSLKELLKFYTLAVLITGYPSIQFSLRLMESKLRFKVHLGLMFHAKMRHSPVLYEIVIMPNKFVIMCRFRIHRKEGRFEDE